MKRALSLLILLLMSTTFFLVLPVSNVNGYETTDNIDNYKNTEGGSTYNENVKEQKEADTVETLIKEVQEKLEEIEIIEDKKDWFIAYKEIINSYTTILDPPKTIYDYYDENELNLLFGVVQAEVGDEYSFEQKVNVAAVIFNRIENKEFADNMGGVLTSDQFCTIRNGSYKRVEVSETTILACEYAFMFSVMDSDILFFDSNGALNYEKVFNDGAHNFYKVKKRL